MDFGLVGDKTGNLGFWEAGGGWVQWRKAGGGGGSGCRRWVGLIWILGRRGTEERECAVRLFRKNGEKGGEM
jgi:hypothetical protein